MCQSLCRASSYLTVSINEVQSIIITELYVRNLNFETYDAFFLNLNCLEFLVLVYETIFSIPNYLSTPTYIQKNYTPSSNL